MSTLNGELYHHISCFWSLCNRCCCFFLNHEKIPDVSDDVDALIVLSLLRCRGVLISVTNVVVVALQEARLRTLANINNRRKQTQNRDYTADNNAGSYEMFHDPHHSSNLV